MPENTYEHRLLCASDKAVLYALDKLLTFSRINDYSWFELARINACVRELQLGITSLTVKQCLDRLVAEGIVKYSFLAWWCEHRYTLNRLPEVTHLRHRVKTDAQCNTMLNYNSLTQEVYERAVVACLAASAAEKVRDSVETVYNRRLTERTEQMSGVGVT